MIWSKSKRLVKLEEISSELDPRLVYQEIESDNEVTSGGNKNDNSLTVDDSLLIQLQTENENLKIKLNLVEDNFDEIKSNYDSIK